MTWLPIRDEQAVAWELRGAWASGRPVSVRLNEDLHPVVPRLVGRVIYVSPTGAYAEVDPGDGLGAYAVPCAAVLSVRKPHFSEPLDQPVRAPEPAPAMPGQLSLGEEVSS